MNKTVIALLLGALGTLFFTLVYASGKLAGGNISAFQIMFVRYVSGLLILICIVAAGKKPFSRYKSKRPYFHIYRSFCGTMGAICIIHASNIAPIADVTALGLTDGLLTVLLSVVFLGEVVSRFQWIGGLLCALGAIVVVYGSGNGQLFNDLNFGLWLALLSALLIAIDSVLIKFLTFSENTLSILLHVNLFSMLILLVPAMHLWKTPTTAQLIFFILLGPIAIFAQYCWIKAYSLEDVSVVTPINYTWIIFATILGYLLFDEALDRFTLLGAFLIVFGGIILARSAKPIVKTNKFNTMDEN